MEIHKRVADTTGVVHRFVLDFELIFLNERKFHAIQSFIHNWWWLSIVYAFFYIILIFIGRAWMARKDQKYELRTALVLWNASLTIFSLWGAFRCVPELINIVIRHGFMYSICDSQYKQGITGLWVCLFMASKVPETIDTLFIVLRRQELIFLHWYHHATVLVYCFYSYAFFASTGRWFVSMNYCVHTLMYCYFALRAARIRIPPFVQVFITLLQIVQMIAGCVVNVAAYNYKQKGYSCGTTDTNIALSLALYASYFMLFAHFFYMAYLKKGLKKKK
ncbi:unnamed protein product [Rotaria socialis]|uniref:Elongation of very long chain fatty acids protein n=1 Tax=Rotaria socialis TaxID=392032 RepID=A0A820XKH9_9BILA|nr:unnamed protein product [Rotaria socialis]CAF3562686.1 unnamed protein product [Rotaria socialis]CAF3682281.1 unnamed protein product [Rotaria socialis]CAF3782490.1 unnamed protein product [Rotaria socialis]CAF4161673.1 unnamed protein product [Rotaria socialis]